jgi:hypothetical protein
MAKPKGHKKTCRCPFCAIARKKSAARKRKPAKRTARKKNPVSRKRNGKLGTWLKAKAVRVRKVAGRLLVDIRK